MDATPEPEARSGVRIGASERQPAELLAAIRRGDSDAFEALARENAPALFRTALRLTGRREDAEDLVQEVLVRALPALRRFEGRAKLSTYLFRAMGNLWKNQLRSKQRSRVVEWFRRGTGDEAEDERTSLDPPDQEPLPLERMQAEERAVEVQAAVAQLDPPRRLTLLLREVEQMSYEEIAVATEVPVGTVRSRLARAREDLRRLLGDRT
jgi:RNA polymerase sigma-70 factor (ECF subfamily)